MLRFIFLFLIRITMSPTTARQVNRRVILSLVLVMLAAISMTTQPVIGIIALQVGPAETSATLHHGSAPALPSTTRTTAPLNGTIAVGLDPDAISYDPVDGKLFVANYQSNNISVISDSTNTVTATIPSGSGPNGAAYDPVTGDVFIANRNSNNVTVVSAANGQVVATIPVGNTPQGDAYDPANGDVYVANAHANTVTVISGSSLKTVANVSVGSIPVEVAYDSQSRSMYVSDYGGSVVSVISSTNNSVIQTMTVGSGPEELAYDSSNNELYVVDSGSASVSAVNATTGTLVATISVGSSPYAITTDGNNGNLYVTGGGNVYVISSATNAVTGTITVGTAWLGIAFDSGKGAIYVLDSSSNQVSYFTVTSTGSCTPTIQSFTASPSSIILGNRTTLSVQATPGCSPTQASWSNITASAGVPPAPRYDEASFAYDPADGYSVLFGGCTSDATLSCNSVTNDTWVFQGGHWLQLHPTTSPSARTGAMLAYDAADGYLVLFGGTPAGNACGATGGPYNDTWTFRAGNWTQLAISHAPTPRCDAGFTWDARDGYLLLYGGTNLAGPLGDTWTFRGGVWTQLNPPSTPGSRYSFQMTYDVADSYVLLFGGWSGSANLGDTWTFAGGSWSQIIPTVSPSGRAGSALAYDNAMNATILFGGNNANSMLNDTWVYLSGKWTNVTSTMAPPARTNSLLVYDNADSAALIFGGARVSKPVLGDTWALTVTTSWLSYSYSGLPSGCLSTNVTSLTCTPTVTGTFTVHVFVNDTAGHSTSATVVLAVYPAVKITSFTATPNPVLVNHTTYLNVTATGGAGILSYAYAGLPTGCTSSNVTSLVCVPTMEGTFNVTVTASSSLGSSASAMAQVQVATQPNPLLVSLSVFPASGIVPLQVTLNGTATGGVSPYSFAWSFGDGTAGSGPSVGHTYNQVGNFTTMLTVTDSKGTVATSTSTIVVSPQPGSNETGAIEIAISADPVTGPAPLKTHFHASAAGGDPPYTINWSFGDGGVGVGPSVFHTYNTSGEYVATVVVTDSVHNQAVSGVFVTVSGSGGKNLPLAVLVTATNMHGKSPLPVTFMPAVRGGVGPYRLTWSFGDGSAPVVETTIAPVTHVFSGSGTYHPNLAVTDSTGGMSNWSQSASTSERSVTVTSPSHGTTPGFLGLSLIEWVLPVVLVVAILGVMLYRSKKRRLPPPSLSKAGSGSAGDEEVGIAHSGSVPQGPEPPVPPQVPDDDPFRYAVDEVRWDEAIGWTTYARSPLPIRRWA